MIIQRKTVQHLYIPPPGAREVTDFIRSRIKSVTPGGCRSADPGGKTHRTRVLPTLLANVHLRLALLRCQCYLVYVKQEIYHVRRNDPEAVHP